MKTGIELIAEERQRQIEKEGWTSEHDASHFNGELAKAAACYAVVGTDAKVIDPYFDLESWAWPFEKESWKPHQDKIRNLIKAGALIAAEIDRINAIEKTNSDLFERAQDFI